MQILRLILLVPIALFLLYFSIVHSMMSIFYGRNWTRYEKALDKLDQFQENILSKIRMRKSKPMKTVTIYTDGGYCCANPVHVNPCSPLKRQPQGNDNKRRRRKVI